MHGEAGIPVADTPNRRFFSRMRLRRPINSRPDRTTMSPSSILRRHRVAALLGAALIISPVVVSFAQNGGNASLSNAVATTQTPVAGITAPNGSFAPVVATTKPAVVTVTTVMKAQAQPDAMSEGSPFDRNSPFDQYFRQF